MIIEYKKIIIKWFKKQIDNRTNKGSNEVNWLVVMVNFLKEELVKG